MILLKKCISRSRQIVIFCSSIFKNSAIFKRSWRFCIANSIKILRPRTYVQNFIKNPFKRSVAITKDDHCIDSLRYQSLSQKRTFSRLKGYCSLIKLNFNFRAPVIIVKSLLGDCCFFVGGTSLKRRFQKWPQGGRGEELLLSNHQMLDKEWAWGWKNRIVGGAGGGKTVLNYDKRSLLSDTHPLLKCHPSIVDSAAFCFAVASLVRACGGGGGDAAWVQHKDARFYFLRTLYIFCDYFMFTLF